MSKEILEEAYRTGISLLQKRLDAGKDMPGLLIVELEGKQPLMMMFKPTDEKEEQRKKNSAVMFIMMARALKLFRSASIVSEAWISKNEEYGKNGKRPFDDPNKMDCAMCLVRTEDAQKMGSIPIKSMGGRRWLDYTQAIIMRSSDQKTRMTGWLDRAFKDPSPVMEPEREATARAAFDMLVDAFGGDIL